MLDQLKKTLWYKVRKNTAKKVFTITKQVFDTKTEGMKTVKSPSYDIMSYKTLTKLISLGWTEHVKSWQPKNLEGDAKIEADIKAYEARMTKKKEREERLRPKFEEVEPFDYTKLWNKQYKKQEKCL